MFSFPRRVVLAVLAIVPVQSGLLSSSQETLADPGLEAISVTTSSGRTVSGLLGVPASVPAPAVLVMHGSAGVSDNIKGFVRDFARDGFFAVALDLFDGKTASDPAARSALVGEANSNPAKTTETVTAWIEWLKADPRTNGKVGVVGWSFGAGWAVRASIAAPVDGTVMYVGVYNVPGMEMARIKGPLLGHFGKRDFELGKHVVEAFDKDLKAAGKSFEVHWYDGDHFFSIPSYPSYDKEQADAAWARTVQFFRENLR